MQAPWFAGHRNLCHRESVAFLKIRFGRRRRRRGDSAVARWVGAALAVLAGVVLTAVGGAALLDGQLAGLAAIAFGALWLAMAAVLSGVATRLVGRVTGGRAPNPDAAVGGAVALTAGLGIIAMVLAEPEGASSLAAAIAAGAAFALVGLILIAHGLGIGREDGGWRMLLQSIFLTSFALVSFIAFPPGGIFVVLIAVLSWIGLLRALVKSARGRDPLEDWSQEKVLGLGCIATVGLGALFLGAVALLGRAGPGGSSTGATGPFERVSTRGVAPRHAARVTALARLDDGRVVTSDAAGLLRLWDVPGGDAAPRTLARSDDTPIDAIVAIPGGGLAVADDEGRVSAWRDAALERWGALIRRSGIRVRGLAASADGARLAVSFADGSLRVVALPLATPLLKQTPTEADSDLAGLVAFDASGTHVIVAPATAAPFAVAVPPGDGTDPAPAPKGLAALGPVSAIDRLRDGRFAVGTPDGATLLLDPTSGASHAIDVGGHRARVIAVSAAPDASLLATAGADGTVRIVSTADGRCLRALDGLPEPAIAIATHAGGAGVAAALGHAVAVRLEALATLQRSRNATVRASNLALTGGGRAIVAESRGVYAEVDLATGETLRTITGAPESSHAWPGPLGADPAGRHLVTSAHDALWLWDLAAGRELRRLAELDYRDETEAVLVAPDGRHAVVRSARGLRGFGLPGGEPIAWLGAEAAERGPTSIAFAADGERVLVGGADGDVSLRRIADGEVLARWPRHEGTVDAVALPAVADAEVALSAAAGSVVRLHRIANGEVIWERPAETEAGPWELALSADGALAAIKEGYEPTRIVDARTGASFATADGKPGGLAFLDDGRHLVRGFRGPGARILDVDRARWISREHAGPILDLAVGDATVVTAGGDGRVGFWAVWKGVEPDQVVPGHAAPVAAAAISSEASIAFTGDLAGMILRWDLTTRPPSVSPVGAQPAAVTALAITADGGLVAGGADGVVRVLDLETGAERRRFAGLVDEVTALAVAGGRVLVGGRDGRAVLIQLDDGSTAPVQDYSDALIRIEVTAVALDRAGRRAFIGTNRGGVEIHDPPGLASREEAAAMGADAVTDLSISADGARLAASLHAIAPAHRGGGVSVRDISGRHWQHLSLELDRPDVPLAVGFTPDGRRLFVGTATGRLLTFEAR